MASINRFKLKSELLEKEGCYIVELQNVKEDPTCSIARARVEPGVTTKWHRLRGTAERYMILEGVGEVEIGEPPVSVAPFDVVYIPAGARQRIRNIGSGDLIFLCICIPRFRPKAYEKLEG